MSLHKTILGGLNNKFFLLLCAIIVIWFLNTVLITYYYTKWSPKTLPLNTIEERLIKLENEVNHQMNELKSLINDIEDEAGSNGTPVIPVLVISCNRVTVSRCLDKLLKYRPNKQLFPIIISQDCNHTQTYNVINSYVDRDPSSISVIKQPDLSEIQLPKQNVKFRGYYKIARHYKFALDHVFVTLKKEAVIIVEDDLDISSDFFEYFLGTYPLLKRDPTLWCISAWNDNGKRGLIDESHPETLYRTDFFPGLGWLLRQDSWLQLRNEWPPAFFDDWLRDPVNTRQKACLRPEISRTYSFGKVGVSKGLFFDNHLKYIELNNNYVDFKSLDLSYLEKDNFDRMWAQVTSLPVRSAQQVLEPSLTDDAQTVQVQYHDAISFKKVAKKLGAMDDYRSGIPRTAYKGIVPLFIKKRRVYITPSYKWTGYDPNWS